MATNGKPDPNCEHEKVDLIGGNGDERGMWDTFRCAGCGWTFDLEHIETQG